MPLKLLFASGSLFSERSAQITFSEKANFREDTLTFFVGTQEVSVFRDLYLLRDHLELTMVGRF